MPRYFVSIYTDGPATRWNVIDRRTQEWVRRFSTEQEALGYAAALNDPLTLQGQNNMSRDILIDRALILIISLLMAAPISVASKWVF